MKKTTASKSFEVLGPPLQGLLGDGRAVGSEVGLPLARASPQVVERDHGGGDRLVLVALALADDQQSSLLLLGGGRAGHPRMSITTRTERITLMEAS